MEAPSQSATQEAKQLNVTLEHDEDGWIAVLPSPPDQKDDEAVGFPAPSEQEALDEARAFRSIEQSKVFKFEYDEGQDQYVVTFSDKTFFGKYLAPTYRDAQKAYAEFINKPEPPKPEQPTAPKQARKRRQPQPGVPADAPEPIPPAPHITSGIGNGAGQLAPSVSHEDIRKEARAAIPPGTSGNNQWDELSKRIDRLEDILRDALTATAKALEELKKR
jgi:hypothetical protein